MNFDSLNRETGLLEDMDDTRKTAQAVLSVAYSIMTSPLVLMTMPRGLRVDYATILATAKSYVEPTSQAGFVRYLGELLGSDPRYTEEYIRELHLSETLPLTHPDVPNPEMPDEPIPTDLAKESYVMGKLDKMEKEARKPKQPERVELPGEIDRLLREMAERLDGKPKED